MTGPAAPRVVADIRRRVVFLEVKRLTTCCASLALLQNVFAVHPEGGSLRYAQLLISYVMKSITEISRLRRLSPPFGALRHHLPPAVRWDYNPPRSNHLISISRRRAAKTSPSGGSGAQHQKGCISIGRSPVCLFFYARRAVVWFSISRSEI